MSNLNRTAITYFTSAFLITASFCLAVIDLLNWPVMAELPLAISIYIQMTAVVKVLYTYVEKQTLHYGFPIPRKNARHKRSFSRSVWE